MFRGIVRLLLLLTFIGTFLLSTVVTFAATPVVDIYMFYSDTCPHCHKVINEILPGIKQQFGDKINLLMFEISTPKAFELAVAMEKVYQVPEEDAGVPEIFVGKAVLIGDTAIQNNLAREIQTNLDAGGFRLPPPEWFLSLVVKTPAPVASPAPGQTPTIPGGPTPSAAMTVTPTAGATLAPSPTAPVSPTQSLTPVAAKPIHLAYFYEVGCKECDRAQYEINYLKSVYPNLVVDSFDIVENAALNDWVGEKYGLPASERLVGPIVFVGQDHLLKKAVTVENLDRVLAKYRETGAEAVWQQWEDTQGMGKIAGLFQNVSLFAVIGAGLVDGLNPCAFATIVFFVAYLAFVGRKGREILFTGIAFTIGVFTAYLLLGVGLLRVMEAANVTRFGRWFYLIAAALCLGLAVVNIVDFFKARAGKPEQMQMRLPLSLRRWINRIIREGSGLRAYMLVALVTGFIVSVIELACTGQVYIVILSALSHPGLRSQALGYLVIYNLAFIVPLVIVFLAAFFGVSSDQLARLVERRTATVKLLTALLFLVLGLWLVYAFLPLFGIRLMGA